MLVNQPISSPSRAVDLFVMREEAEEEETDGGPGIVEASRVLIPKADSQVSLVVPWYLQVY